MKRMTIRMRLTVLYGTLFLLAGILLLGVTYLLVEQTIEVRSPMVGGVRLEAARPGTFLLANGQEVTPGEIMEAVRAEQERFRAETLESFLTQGGIALAGVAVVAVGFGWLLAGRALAPVHRITDTARRIAASGAGRGLHERIALAGPRDEVRELADTFDAMLERLDRSFDGQRRFVANASHEIRTPLALNRALVELAVSRPDASQDVRSLGESLLAINERHERLIDGLLMLADSENQVVERTPVDLSEVANHVLDHLPAAGLAVRRQLRPAPTGGEPILLERLVSNLVENAVRHNLPDHGWVSVTTGVEAGQATLVVANTGLVVASYEVPALFEPFRRLGTQRTGGGRGFGLGLSIVRAIATAHGGEVSAVPRDDGGLIVTVRLAESG